MQAAYNIFLSLLVVIYYFFCYSLLHIVFPVKKKVALFSLKEYFFLHSAIILTFVKK
jgi:hypothetical protein